METSPHAPVAPAQSAANTWLPDLVEAVQQRRQLAARVALGVAGLGVLVALVAPGVLSPRPAVGFVIGIVAVLLALAVVVVADNADIQVRGARHVRATGGHHLGTITQGIDGVDGGPVLDDIADHLFPQGTRRVIGVAPAGGGIDDSSDGVVAEAVALAAAGNGRRTMFMHLGDPGARGDRGVAEVARGTARFADVVRFHDGLPLARVGAGSDPLAALDSLPDLLPKLPSDIEALVVALPADLGGGAVLGAIDELVVVAERDRTRRIDLVRSLGGQALAVSRSVLLVEAAVPPAAAAAVVAPALEDLELSPEADEVRVVAADADTTDGVPTLRPLLRDRPEADRVISLAPPSEDAVDVVADLERAARAAQQPDGSRAGQG